MGVTHGRQDFIKVGKAFLWWPVWHNSPVDLPETGQLTHAATWFHSNKSVPDPSNVTQIGSNRLRYRAVPLAVLARSRSPLPGLFNHAFVIDRHHLDEL